MGNQIKIGIAVDIETANKISDIAAKLKKATREGKLPKRPGRSVGDGSVAAEIVERVIRDYPELLKEFFEAESGEALPKAASRRQAPK